MTPKITPQPHQASWPDHALTLITILPFRDSGDGRHVSFSPGLTVNSLSVDQNSVTRVTGRHNEKRNTLTSLPLVRVHRHGHVNSVNVEVKFHLECRLCFPCAQFRLRQMHRANLSVSIEAKYWVSWLSPDVEWTWKFVILCNDGWLEIEVSARQKSVFPRHRTGVRSTLHGIYIEFP